MKHETAGTVRVPGMPVKYTACGSQRSPNGVPAVAAPRLAEHTRDVLVSLGYTSEQVATLEQTGAVGRVEPVRKSENQ